MKNFLLSIFCLLLNASISAQQKDTVQYLLHMDGMSVGYSKFWKENNTTYREKFYMLQNNRGMNYESTIKTDGKLKILSIHYSGEYIPGGPFTYSTMYRGDSIVSEENGIETVYPATGRIISSIFFRGKYIQASPDKSYVGYTNDTVRLERTDRFFFDVGGKKVDLQRMQFKDGAVWYDLEGNFVANQYIILKPYQSLIEPLKEKEKVLEMVKHKEDFDRLSDRLPEKFAIANTSLFDAPNAKVLHNVNILVEHGKIVYVGKKKIPKKYQIIDGKNRFVMPGMWDTHAHYFVGNGKSYLAGGITHIRDMGNKMDLLRFREAIRNREMLGPDFSILAGFIDYKSGYNAAAGKVVTTKQEALDAIDEYHNNCLLYTSPSPRD